MWEADGATHHLIGLSWVDTEANVYLDRLVELRGRGLLHQGSGLSWLVLLLWVDQLCRFDVTLTVLCHRVSSLSAVRRPPPSPRGCGDRQATTSTPIDFADPSIILQAASIVGALRSVIFLVAISCTCARVILPTLPAL